MVERWFGEISRRRIRRGSFESVEQLIAAIEEYLARYNQSPKKFMWTKDADMILSKIARCKEAPVRDTSRNRTCSPSRLPTACLPAGPWPEEAAEAARPGRNGLSGDASTTATRLRASFFFIFATKAGSRYFAFASSSASRRSSATERSCTVGSKAIERRAASRLAWTQASTADS